MHQILKKQIDITQVFCYPRRMEAQKLTLIKSDATSLAITSDISYPFTLFILVSVTALVVLNVAGLGL